MQFISLENILYNSQVAPRFLENLQTPAWDRTRVCLNHSMAFGSFTYKQTKQLADETSAGLVLTVSDLHGDAILFDVSCDVMCVYTRLAIRNDLLHCLCTSDLGFQRTRVEFPK